MKDYISKNVPDEDDKLEYFTALYAELRSNKKKIEPVQFIQDHIGDDHKGPLLQALKDRGVPSAAFVKDVTDLPRQGRAPKLKTVGGLTISGEPEAMEAVGTGDVDGEHVIVIRDSLRAVQ